MNTTSLLPESQLSRLPRMSRRRAMSNDLGMDTSGPPRIVILSASVGAGHVRAAQAIQTALARLLPNATIAHVDILSLTNGMFRQAYSTGYFGVVDRAPHMVGMLYDLLDKPGGGSGAAGAARLAFERLNFSRLARFLTKHPWDLAITTHFLSPAIIGWLRRRERVEFPQLTVVTDYDVHGMWINAPCEGYCVATGEARANVVAGGVADSDVHVTGIPIDPLFE